MRMRWVKRIEQPILSQESDIPYVIHQNGVLLCFDNMYQEGNLEFEEKTPSIVFRTNRSKMKRHSANFMKFIDFPTLVPFEDIIHLDETIINGEVVRSPSEQNSDVKSIAVVKQRFVARLSEDELQDFTEETEEFNDSFFLIGDNINSTARAFCDLSNAILHVDWGRTCVSIANIMCQQKTRKYCWTSQVPALEITTYGLKPGHDIDNLYRTFSDIGVEVSTEWGG